MIELSNPRKFKVFLTAIFHDSSRIPMEVEVKGNIVVEEKETMDTLEYLKGKMLLSEPVYLNFNIDID